MHNWLYKIALLALCLTSQLYPAAHNKNTKEPDRFTKQWKGILKNASLEAAAWWVTHYPQPPQNQHFKLVHQTFLTEPTLMEKKEAEDCDRNKRINNLANLSNPSPKKIDDLEKLKKLEELKKRWSIS